MINRRRRSVGSDAFVERLEKRTVSGLTDEPDMDSRRRMRLRRATEEELGAREEERCEL